jgi:hypothetical protein
MPNCAHHWIEIPDTRKGRWETSKISCNGHAATNKIYRVYSDWKCVKCGATQSLPVELEEWDKKRQRQTVEEIA